MADTQVECVAIDFGGVVAGGSALVSNAENDDVSEDTKGFFGENYLDVAALPSAFEFIEKLVAKVGAEHCHIVSKAGTKVQEKTRHWMRHHRFFESTGFNVNNVHFCRERADKADICKRINATRMIDDAPANLVYVAACSTMASVYLFVHGERRWRHGAGRRAGGKPQFIVDSWQTFYEVLLKHMDGDMSAQSSLEAEQAQATCQYDLRKPGSCRNGSECRFLHLSTLE
jgi:hypothetical protein